ncbi:MAG: hypothetical protein O3A10_00075 [Chloroflexi bacterium]|nr:hypothetical protein [Chloroflexota bacterium]MDA1145353.1 hypothetical protein [Chloroflexota bacterium]
MPRLLTALTALLCLLLLAGCGSEDDTPTASPTPTSAPSPIATIEATATLSPTPTESATATTEPTAEPTGPAEPELNPEPATVSGRGIQGLGEVTDARIGAPFGLDVRYPRIASLDPFNAAVAAEVQRQIDEFSAQIGTPTPLPDGRIPQELTLTWRLLVASADVIGVRLDTYRFFGANGAESSTTIWFDLQGGEAMPAVALIKDNASIERLRTLVAAVIARDRPDDGIDLDVPTPPIELYDTLGFDAAGRLIVTFDEAEVAASFVGQVSVAIAAEDVEPLLSAFGLRALAEALDPATSLGIGVSGR